MRFFLLALLAVSIVGVGACGGGDEDDTAATTEPAASAGASGEPAPESGSKPKPDPGTEITTAPSDYGTVLWGPDRQAIYLFDKESSDASECYGDCAAAWPPVLTDGEPQAAGDVDPKLLGTTDRDDGETQVTYGGHPLYYYVDDPPGQILCQNVSEFGGLWLVVDSSGAAVQ